MDSFMRALVFILTALAIMAMILGCGGCGQVSEKEEQITFDKEDIDVELAFCVDTSGSYERFLLDESDGRAFKRIVLLKDDFFKGRATDRSRILLSRINGSDKQLLWSGRPHQFRTEFPNARKLKEELLRNNTGGSRVYDTMTDTLDELIRHHNQNPGMVSAFVALTDMDNNIGDSKSENRLIDTFKQYGKCGKVIVEIDYCEQSRVTYWTRILTGQCGFQHARVFGDHERDLTRMLLDP